MREFAKRNGIRLPSNLRKANLQLLLRSQMKSLFNVDVDADVDARCNPPDSYNSKMWDFVLENARKHKKWAINLRENPEKIEMLSGASKNAAMEYLESSVCDIAKKEYEYKHLRAHGKSKSMWGNVVIGPLDPAAKREWERITGEKI